MCAAWHPEARAGNSKIDSITALLPGLKGTELADAYLKLAEECLYTTPNKTIEYAELALAIVNGAGQKKQLCYANLLTGAGYLYMGDFSTGEKFTKIGLEMAQQMNDPDYISIGLSSMAAYHMNTGDYDQALRLFEETLEITTKAGLEDRVARVKFNIGSILTNKGERAAGLKHLIEALKYFEAKDNVTIVARILNNIAVNYHSWNNYELALEYYRKTLRVYERNGDILAKVVVLNNIGEIYKDKGQYEMALAYYNQIFDLAEKNEIGEFYKAVGRVGLAETYANIGNDRLARENAEQSLAVFKAANMQEGEINALLVLARVNMNEGNLEKAREQAELCISQSNAMGIVGLEQKAYLLNSKILQKQNNYPRSLENYKKYVAITDSLNREMQSHQLALHRAELDLSEKEREIGLLQKDNEIKDLQLVRQKARLRTLIVILGFLGTLVVLSFSYNKARKRANELLQQKNNQIVEQHEELVQLNHTKDKFLSIIGHDLRNPIGAFKDVVSQLADFPEMFTDELRKQILEELRDEAESTYFLLDNLLLWAKAQQNSIQFKPERLKMNLIIKNNLILNSRIAERKKVVLTADTPDEIVVYADHNMVDLVLRNLISNAIKFTPANGKVELSVAPKEDFFEITVKDTGVGISETDLPRLFSQNDNLSTYGTNNEKGSGLGLILCKEFIELNGGVISVSSEIGKGSAFSFTLKRCPAFPV